MAGNEEVERLKRELAESQAQANRYRSAYEGSKAREAEAARQAKIEQAGALTDEEKEALETYAAVDPKGKQAIDALQSSMRRRELAMLEAGVAAAGGGADDGRERSFDDSVTAAMGSADWLDTVKTPEYHTWFYAQPKAVRDLAADTANPGGAVRVLSMYESHRNGGGKVPPADPRLEGARNAPGGGGLRISQTRGLDTRSGSDDEIDEESYEDGWNYAGRMFEDNYRMLHPDMNQARYDDLRARR